ncbi:MAG: dipeptide epimerase [Planctomycetes bacterium]|nr:dipeptide epimerase [Planctomycetota bacterium]
MKVRALDVATFAVPLARPYAIAHHQTDAVALARIVVTLDCGTTGLGTATPEPRVTGESFARCEGGLRTALPWLRSVSFEHPHDLTGLLRGSLGGAPAARAALDMALHDAWGKRLGRPVVDLLGRVHDALPTSITIGVRDVPDTLAEAREYLGRGFRILKVKVGEHVDLDVERLTRLRELVGIHVPLLADANVGYTLADLRTFLDRTRGLDLALVEQPLPREHADTQHDLPAADVERLVADESLLDPADADRLHTAPRAFGVWNIKLMKCGGIAPALAIARTATAAATTLMWGCMDESVVGIAAALHAAFASPATRWLDLDGSFDLSRDVARGGFALQDGVLRPLDRPGLGVEPFGA